MNKIFNITKRIIVLVMCVAFFSLAATTLEVYASNCHLYITDDMEDGTYTNRYRAGGVTVIGTVTEPMEVKSCNKYYGEYEFNKCITMGAASFHYKRKYAVSANLYEDQKVIVFVQSTTGETARVSLANADGIVIATKEVPPSTGDEVTKLEFDTQFGMGVYYIYSENVPIELYAVYFGGISDAEREMMGEEIDSSEPYYNFLIKDLQEDREPVLLITLIVFAISVIAFCVIVTVKKGRGSIKKLVATGRSKSVDDELTYKE